MNDILPYAFVEHKRLLIEIILYYYVSIRLHTFYNNKSDLSSYIILFM